MDKIKLMTSIVFLLMAIAIMPSAMATVTGTPAASTVLTGSVNFTASTSLSATATNLTVWIDGVAVCTGKNSTAAQNFLSCVYDTSGSTDSAAASVNWSMANVSYAGTHIESLVRSHELDNTDPTDCEDFTLAPFPNVRSGSTVTYDASKVLDAIDTSVTYSIVMTKPVSSGTSTKTASTGEWTGADTQEKGDYTIALTVTDNAGNTCTKTHTLRVGSDSDSTGVAQAVLGSNNSKAIIIIVMGIIVTAIVGYAIYASTSRGHKRIRRR